MILERRETHQENGFLSGRTIPNKHREREPKQREAVSLVEFRDAHIGSRCGRGGRGRRNRHISNEKWPELFQM